MIGSVVISDVVACDVGGSLYFVDISYEGSHVFCCVVWLFVARSVAALSLQLLFCIS